MQICPNCAITLEKQSKKLGACSRWYVCPKCGHRERPDNEAGLLKKRSAFIRDIRTRNKNINQFNRET